MDELDKNAYKPDSQLYSELKDNPAAELSKQSYKLMDEIRCQTNAKQVGDDLLPKLSLVDSSRAWANTALDADPTTAKDFQDQKGSEIPDDKPSLQADKNDKLGFSSAYDYEPGKDGTGLNRYSGGFIDFDFIHQRGDASNPKADDSDNSHLLSAQPVDDIDELPLGPQNDDFDHDVPDTDELKQPNPDYSIDDQKDHYQSNGGLDTVASNEKPQPDIFRLD